MIAHGWKCAALYLRYSCCIVVLAVSVFFPAVSVAGPPYQTDDPDPVPYKHFEMYAFTLLDSTGPNGGGTALEIPGYEVNYGGAPNLQLHLVITPLVNFAPSGGETHYGIGDTELGFKYRLIKESKWFPETGIFPFFELPSGNAGKGLGVGKAWYRLPLWFQKSWGPDGAQWTTYGGGGETIVPQTEYRNFPFAGWLVQRQFGKKITPGFELFGHGNEGPAATAPGAAVMADIGGQYEFHDGFDLLFAAGRSIHGQPETYGYLALYWTWGPKVTEENKAQSAELSRRWVHALPRTGLR